MGEKFWVGRVIVFLIAGIFAFSIAAVSAYAYCQPGYCESSNYESNEGPGGNYCCSNQGGSSGYEECKHYFFKSTVYIYSVWTGELIDKKTDYCIDSSRLIEYYMDCDLGNDKILSTEKNCNDYDKYGDWEYYCTSTQVRKHHRFYNQGCSGGECELISNNWVDDTLISKKGNSDYCDKRKQYDCTLCGHGDYDCNYDSECSGSLECMGPIGGALDGCCYPGERWDEVNYRCCECSPGDGPCCDGCHYRSSSYICDSHYGSYYYDCPSGQCVWGEVERRDKKRYCSGSSSSCIGSIEWNSWQTYAYCSGTYFCDADNAGWNPFSCSKAQCTSGVCCDAACGVYEYKSSSTRCSEGTEYGCPWGTDLGDDAGKRTVTQYCLGSSDSCSGQITYSGWTVHDDCNSKEYCEAGECKAIACSQESDCGIDYWIYEECKDNDIWGEFKDFTCLNPGERNSKCTWEITYRRKEDCGEDGYVGDRYCWNYNMQPSVFQDYATRWCESDYCHEEIDEQLIKICQQDCTDGQCNEDICQDECFSGQTRCNGNYKQTCGDYDDDLCLEFPSSITGPGNEECICGCQDGNCMVLEGDIDGNYQVNIFDLAAVGLAFGSRPGDSNWNPNADLNGDGVVNIFDLATVGLNYGNSC